MTKIIRSSISLSNNKLGSYLNKNRQSEMNITKEVKK